jgi:hypothetical protein
MHQTFTGVDFAPLPIRREFSSEVFIRRQRRLEIVDAED